MGAGLSIRRRAVAEEQPVRVLGWSNFFSPAVADLFRELTGIEIEVTPIGSLDDVVLFLRAGGIGLYDVVTPTSGLLVRMAAEGLIEPIDESRLMSLDGLFEPFRTPSWAISEAGRVGVPVVWGALAAVYPEEAAGSSPESWIDLLGEPFAKRVVMPDDALGHFWIWNWAMGADEPTRVSRDQLRETTEMLIGMKRSQVTAWESSVFSAMRRMARGRGTIASVGWQSAPLLSEPGERILATTYPLPGTASFCDCLAVVSGAPQREAALALIDLMISAEAQAIVANDTRWATVTAAAVPMINPDVAELVDYGDLENVLRISPIRGYPPFTDDGEDVATYLDWVVAWDRVRATPVGG
ncbi:spermidine/putrescine ABC transporter substrate-binding protein [soil metagenome]